MLNEAAEREAELTVEPLDDRISKTVLLGVTGFTPPPKLSVEIIG